MKTVLSILFLIHVTFALNESFLNHLWEKFKKSYGKQAFFKILSKIISHLRRF